MAIRPIHISQPQDLQLVGQALQATAKSYSPYSHFEVGAAVRMEDGRVFSASNQENAAYPACVCAERVALLYATANSDSRPECIAIVAKNAGRQTLQPVTPCGECRQVLREMELRYHAPIRILMCGAGQCLEADSAADLLPGEFSSDQLAR
ncbi:MAG: cytidine deaminase [Paludibacteraceae bacterium]|nr:cytidine deaminase [Paludibacteraceae bacterium]